MSAAMSRGELRSPAPLGQSLSAWADGFFSEEANRDCLVWAPYLRDLFDEYTHCRYCGSLGLRPFLRLLRGYCRTRGCRRAAPLRQDTKRVPLPHSSGTHK